MVEAVLFKKFFVKDVNLSELEQPFSAKLLFDCFDIFYICFDEPNRVENWEQIKKIVPKAQKIEGIKGFDKALKACAEKSKTNYFFVIDGDNQLIEERLDNQFLIKNIQDHWVLSWSSLNSVNGLAYGNGGLKLWPKQVALEIQSHENADENNDKTDYCFIASYYLIDDYVTKTVINKNFRQAFRSGFREGVKMSLSYGKQVDFAKCDFENTLGRQNRLRLKIWCEVGSDVLNGIWAILGARMGLYYNCVEKFDYSQINSYEWIESLLESEVLKNLGINGEEDVNFEFDHRRLHPLIYSYGSLVSKELPTEYGLLSPIQSLRFKDRFKNPRRSGLLKRKTKD